jgi:hypothetical protein
MIRRFPQNDFAAQLRPSVPQGRSGFIAMIIGEWHELVADVSRPFARARIHCAAEERRQAMARVTPLAGSKDKPTD